MHFLNNINKNEVLLKLQNQSTFQLFTVQLQKQYCGKEIKHVYQPFKENLISDQEIVYNYNSPMLETSL